MRSAAARAARRRGSSITMRPVAPAASRAGGTPVVLPAPGGACSTARPAVSSAPMRRGRTSSMGRAKARSRVNIRTGAIDRRRARLGQLPKPALPAQGAIRPFKEQVGAGGLDRHRRLRSNVGRAAHIRRPQDGEDEGSMTETEMLSDRILAGDRRALARAVTLVESTRAESPGKGHGASGGAAPKRVGRRSGSGCRGRRGSANPPSSRPSA